MGKVKGKKDEGVTHTQTRTFTTFRSVWWLCGPRGLILYICDGVLVTKVTNYSKSQHINDKPFECNMKQLSQCRIRCDRSMVTKAKNITV
jgi:hypothetical protein